MAFSYIFLNPSTDNTGRVRSSPLKPSLGKQAGGKKGTLTTIRLENTEAAAILLTMTHLGYSLCTKQLDYELEISIA